MAQSKLRFLKRAAVHWPKSDLSRVPDNTRGIYFLYQEFGDNLNVVYVGLAIELGIRKRIAEHSSRLYKHGKESRFKDAWTHFSAYEVHDNISSEEIKEFEAFFLTAYAMDEHANKLNIKKDSQILQALREETEIEWS